MNEHSKGVVAINIAAVIFGSAALFGKLDVSPLWIVAARGFFAALALLAIGAVRGKVTLPPRKHYRRLVSTGVVVMFHWITFFAAVQWAGVAIATLTFATFPLFTVILEATLKRRWPRFAQVGAGLVIVAAVFLLVDLTNESASRLWGAGAGMASAITFAWFGVTSKKLGEDMSPLMISAAQNGVVALGLAPFLPLAASMPDEPAEWLWLALLGVLTTAVMHQLYFYALQRLSASTCSGFVALEPVYAIVFASIFFAEPLTLTVAASAMLTVGASFALLRSEKYVVDTLPAPVAAQVE
jgi:drug/metabolite transporter (DMT)-like permease